MARTLIASDAFNRASLGTTDWGQLNTAWGTVSINASIQFTSNFDTSADQTGAARWIGAGTFSNDQYSSVKIKNPLAFFGAAHRVGAIVRASADQDGTRDYYEAYIQADSASVPTTVLAKWVNGARTVLGSAAQAWAVDDLLSIEAEGTTIRLCRNGTPLGGSFTVTDSSLATGNPGVAVGSTASLYGDDWEGGNVTAGINQNLAGTATATATASGNLSVTGAVGTLTTPPLKNNAGTVLANEAGTTVHVYSLAGGLVVSKAAQTSNASGVMTITDAAIVPATQYRVVIVLASGAEGLAKLTAT